VADFDDLAGGARRLAGEVADHFVSEIYQEAALGKLPLVRREDLVSCQGRYFAREEDVVVVHVLVRAPPCGVVEAGELPALRPEAGVDILGELGLVAEDGARDSLRNQHLPGGVALEDEFFADAELGEKALAQVGALPDAIDEPLVVDVDGYEVLALLQAAGQVHAVVAHPEMIGIGRTLGHEFPVDVELVGVVGANVHYAEGVDPVEGEALAQQHAPVLEPLRMRRKRLWRELLVEAVHGFQTREGRVANPYAFRRVLLHVNSSLHV
jgi:hypothetical protein